MGSCSLGDSESGYQASPCYSKTKLQLFLLQPPKLQEQQLSRWPCQRSGRTTTGLRGIDQQADQHGILCLVRLSFHEFLLQPGCGLVWSRVMYRVVFVSMSMLDSFPSLVMCGLFVGFRS